MTLRTSPGQRRHPTFTETRQAGSCSTTELSDRRGSAAGWRAASGTAAGTHPARLARRGGGVDTDVEGDRIALLDACGDGGELARSPSSPKTPSLGSETLARLLTDAS